MADDAWHTPQVLPELSIGVTPKPRSRKVAFELDNRPTKAGLYFISVLLPRSIPRVELRKKLSDRLKFKNEYDFKMGAIVMDDGTGKKLLVKPSAAIQAFRKGDFSNFEWLDDVVEISLNQMTYAVGIYVYLGEDWPIPGNMDSVSLTTFDPDGVPIADFSPNKQSYTYIFPGLENPLAAAIVFTLKWGVISAFFYGVFSYLGFMGNDISGSATAIIGKTRAKGFFDNMLDRVDKLADKTGSAAKTGLQLGVVIVGGLLAVNLIKLFRE